MTEIGSGAFGIVYLVRKKNSIQEIYAMKVLFKANLILKRKLRYAVAESNILKTCNHPFILKLYYAFQTPKNLYLILDFCSRGDLLYHLLKRGRFNENEVI
jgi:serine/threonine protein kinase